MSDIRIECERKKNRLGVNIETANAIMIVSPEHGEMWIPVSQLVRHNEAEGWIEVTEWFAKQKGLV